MENQSAENPLSSVPDAVASSNQQPVEPARKINTTIVLLLAVLVSAVAFGFGGFLLGKSANKPSTQLISDLQNIETNLATAPSVATTIPNATTAAVTPSCKDLTSLNGYQFCKDSNKIMSDFIIGPSSLQVGHVSSYSVSPNKEWLFVVRYSDNFTKTGGAPDENALTMIDTKNAAATELFSQIYFPNFTENSWSPGGNGIVFTAGEAATPNILGNPNMFAVVYSTTTCKVIAKNAGPAGIGGDPAYFTGENVHYTGINEEEIEIPFN